MRSIDFWDWTYMAGVSCRNRVLSLTPHLRGVDTEKELC